MRNKSLKLGIFLLLLSVIMWLGSSPLFATTWTVNTTSDDYSSPAAGSLRYAVNNAVTGDVISFDLADYYPATIALDGMFLDINNGMTIQGPGADQLSISGGEYNIVFYIHDTFEPVEISGISIINGFASSGGGMFCRAAYPRINDCTISGNTATSKGGGVYCDNAGPTFNRCTFKDNLAYITTAIEPYGGGLYNYNSYTTLINCTFCGNYALRGGAICNEGSYPEIVNCTFTGNTAYDKSPWTGTGGAIHNRASGSSTVSNCILWGDTPDEVSNNSTSSSYFEYCVVENGDLDTLAVSSNIITTDPMLGTLADNGGPTWTCALREGSSAIDSGKTIEVITTDQRGVSRPQGYGYDIGAYEDDSVPPVEYYVISADWSAGGSVSPTVAYAVVGNHEDKVFTLLPDSGYEIGEVLVDGVPDLYDEATNTYTFYSISQDHNLYTTFSLIIADDDDDKDKKDKDKDDKDKDDKDKDDKDKDDKDKDDLGSSSTGLDGTDGGSGGGCNTGDFVPTVMLLIAPLLLLMRKR